MPSPIKELTASTSKRQKIKRAADENVFTLDSDSSESVQILSSPKKAKKRKRSLPAVDVSEDEDSVEMSFYLYVETPPPPVLNVRKSSAKAPPPQTTELGPYKFNSSITFTDFLRIIANGCQTKTANLALESLQWKFDRPNNAKKNRFPI
ncbi:hypothetical protein B0H13DRAFT_1855619 [Mycena leptocephala]|nr:hypothetical protein B0H13DRAFT_1855619 [Mycena leptocephala]